MQALRPRRAPSPPPDSADAGNLARRPQILASVHSPERSRNPRSAYLTANGIRFHAVQAGEGPLVLLLHGFPEFWYGWRRQIPALAAAGFRVVAPDLRGYNETERPRGVSSYRLPILMADVPALVEALGETEACIVGHDWGGVIAWYVAMHYPSAVRRLAILNAPHPAAYRRELERGSSQLWRSAYAAFFQLPWIPEAFLWAGRSLLLRGPLAPAFDDEEARRRFLDAYPSRKSFEGPLNYYRAAPRGPLPKTLPIDTPTLLLWGERDPYLVPSLANGLERWVSRLEVHRFPHAGHWLHHEIAGEVNERLAAFLASPRP